MVHAGESAAAAGHDHIVRDEPACRRAAAGRAGWCKMQTKSARTWGTLIFFVGVALALVLAVAAIWGDFEAVSYFNTGANYAQFSGLHCPVMMSQSEVAPVSATFENPTAKTIEPFYQVKISGLAAQRSFQNQLQLPPHSSTTVRWTVSANDIDLGWFVMVRLTVLPFAGNPARAATCGMVVLNLGSLSSDQVLPWAVALSLLGVILGLSLREGKEPPANSQEGTLRNGMRATGVAVLLGMLAGFLGLWLIGLIFSAITILLAVILLRVGTT